MNQCKLTWNKCEINLDRWSDFVLVTFSWSFDILPLEGENIKREVKGWEDLNFVVTANLFVLFRIQIWTRREDLSKFGRLFSRSCYWGDCVCVHVIVCVCLCARHCMCVHVILCVCMWVIECVWLWVSRQFSKELKRRIAFQDIYFAMAVRYKWIQIWIYLFWSSLESLKSFSAAGEFAMNC